MRSPYVRLGTTIAVNAVSLGLAAVIFSGFTVTVAWFVVAVLAYSLAGFFLRRLRVARAPEITGGLLLTFVALLVTTLVVPGNGFDLDGWVAWIGTTILVWAAGIAFGEVDRRAPAGVPGKSLA